MGILFNAIASGDLKQVKNLFHLGVKSPRRKIESIENPEQLLNQPKNALGLTPLMFSAQQAAEQADEIFYFLLEKGASPFAQDFEGNTVAHILLKNGHYQRFLLLI